jgi:hypothetical protein
VLHIRRYFRSSALFKPTLIDAKSPIRYLSLKQGNFGVPGRSPARSAVTLSSTVGIAANRQRASVVSKKFVVEFAKATTGPSTPQAAKYAVCFAQDDNSLLRELLGQDTREALIKSDATLSIPSGAKQAAEKDLFSGEIGRIRSSGAKALVDSIGFIRGLKPPSPSGSSFSAVCKARFDFGLLTARLKSCPDASCLCE